LDLIVIAGQGSEARPPATAVVGDVAGPERSSGAGLGPAIAKQIVTDHDGTLGVSSELGVGTTFTITPPATMDPAGARPADSLRCGA
jgi:hypothetical protein